MQSVSTIIKRLLVVLVFNLPSIVDAQICDTINGKVINCNDSFGQKQGFWVEQKKVLVNNSYSNYGSNEGCQYKEIYKFHPIAEGFYKNNRKIGTWHYYSNNEEHIYFDREIEYNNNGSFTEKNYFEKYVLTFNKDSSSISGYLIHQQDSIVIKYSHKKCTFIFNGKEIISIKKADYNKFDYEFFRLKLGEYNMKINAIKSPR